MPKLKEPSIRAKKYIANKVAGMTNKESALRAGYSEAVATTTLKNIESKPIVQEAITVAMEKAGLSEAALTERLHFGLYESKRIHGTQDNFIEVDDNGTMHRFLETALKLKGHLLPAQNNIYTGDVNITVQRGYDSPSTHPATS